MFKKEENTIYVLPIDMEGFPNTELLRELFSKDPELAYKFNQSVSSFELDIGRPVYFETSNNRIIFMPYKRKETDNCDYRLINSALDGLNSLVSNYNVKRLKMVKFCFTNNMSLKTLTENIRKKIDLNIELDIVDV